MEYDLIIRNGIVVDGSGQESARPADVGILGDRIAVVGRLDGATAPKTIDATGKVVCPGFIDVHVHSETTLLDGSYRYGSVLQGVTTHLMAPDGFGWAPLPPERGRQLWEATRFAYGETEIDVNWPSVEDYLALYPDHTPVNLVPQVPHCAVRLAAMGWEARPATDDELTRMKALARAWLEAGAVCLNLGLDYPPSAFADTRELIALCKVAREYGAIYAAHIRYNDLGPAGAWRETIEIGRGADIPVHISHERVDEITAPLLEEAAQSCDLTFESYMYPAGCTHLALMLPIWAQAGGPAGIRERLRDPEVRPLLGIALEQGLGEAVKQGDRPIFAVTQSGRYVGQSIGDAAKAAGEPLGAFALRILEEEDPYALMIYHQGVTPERFAGIVRETIRHPRMMVASDGIYHGAHAHPRAYGCFARVLRRCVREMGAISLEDAIHKMSGFPAERFRIRGRGLLRPDYGADIVIFDPATVTDRATWDEPRREPSGIDLVLVNGQVVVENGRPTERLPGHVLRPLA